ncbi:MAG: DUF427 domain-containing protein [Planctomycetota bacterium]
MLKRPKPDKPRIGQRSVWDFPRPPAVERETREVRIEFGGVVIARTSGALKVLETSHPPVYFVPRGDFEPGVLRPSEKVSTSCEWKGWATYHDVVMNERVASAAGFSYEDPVRSFERIRGMVNVYAGPMDACYVGDERVTPQPGDFYSGWITSDVSGPFKGIPGSWGW